MAVGVSTGGSRCSRMHVAVGGGCRDGKYGLAWDGLRGVQVAFHVATLMPREDERCTNKKRHIGNNFVTIAFLEAGGAWGCVWLGWWLVGTLTVGYPSCAASYSPKTIPGQFNLVHILVQPLSNDVGSLSGNRSAERQAMYRVSVHRRKEVAAVGPVYSSAVVPEESLGTVVRACAVQSDIACRLLHKGKVRASWRGLFATWTNLCVVRHALADGKCIQQRPARASTPSYLSPPCSQQGSKRWCCWCWWGCCGGFRSSSSRGCQRRVANSTARRTYPSRSWCAALACGQ